MSRMARELEVPLLAVCATRGDEPSGAAHSAALREGLALNSRLRADWYVSDFGDCAGDFMLRPKSDAETSASERAIAGGARNSVGASRLPPSAPERHVGARAD